MARAKAQEPRDPDDGREAFDGYWPLLCERDGCGAPVMIRVRAEATYYLCGACSELPWFAVGPHDRDLLVRQEV